MSYCKIDKHEGIIVQFINISFYKVDLYYIMNTHPRIYYQYY